MDFSLSDEQKLIVETARRIGETYGVDYWYEQDRKNAFPQACWQAICEAGLAGAALPEEHGGSGLGMVELALIVEELSAGGGGSTLGQLFMINPIFGGVPISKFGSEQMKRELLPGLTSGKINFCMALTEPDAGTNTLAMKSFAAAQPDGSWRLDGRKIWITAVDAAQKMLVVARTAKPVEGARPTDGISMFIIDVEREGLTYSAIEKVGTQTLSACSVFFDNVRIEPHELVGTLDKGFRELLDVLNTERIVTTASLVGAGRLAERLAVQYANDRKVFGGKPISAYQGLQFPLAQSHAELQCARLMNLNAASLCDQGLPYGTEANIAKLIGSQAASHAIERSMQTMGGMGYAREFHVERLWRDARLFKFAPVSEEMILNYIAIHDLGMPKSY
ncbi:acyl-CoA/acyl-ACP dehydrogenase [Achromobacter sp. SD115]|uniref:Acyl-CoA dehydrogenase, N-terminal domain protein 14 n=1 Tax=Achromobacter xylosoxidans (strain A8) TaxID=762376 RepID=E3HMH8_ACHXA|nr:MULTISPECIES: acyl-CoA dehydrogenase family protein [Achromobacter]ADP18205.1 acyl-CoA dehydrogenase, N-terminal domain protein 14 [Achromobacter xylosoxidans A8]MBO1017077.1 acyl-CoA/acyl-ACP dehydrogenase [Achromobacter sp. SD115]